MQSARSPHLPYARRGPDRRRADQDPQVGDRVRLASDAGQIGMWDLDVVTGEVVADERVAAMFGEPDGTASVEAFFERMHPDDREVTYARMRQALRDCTPLETPYRVVWPDGTVRHLLSRGRAVAGPDGSVVRLVGAITDVTELQAEAEARLRATNAMASLVSVAQALGDAASESDVLDIVIGLGVQVLGVSGAMLALRDVEDGRPGVLTRPLRVVATAWFDTDVRDQIALLPQDFPLPIVEVARTGRPLLLPDRASALARFPDAADLYATSGTGASAALPLQVRGSVLGALGVAWSGSRTFQDGDVELLGSFAALCSQALDRVRAQDRERAAAAAALGLSEALQRSLLTSPPQPDHLAIAARYQPAASQAQIGGDWHDSFLGPDGDSTFLVIGDVSGHDQTAAVLMGQLRNLLRAIVYTAVDGPAAAFEQLERTLAGLQVDGLASAVLMQVQHAEGAERHDIVWCNAGHLPPLVHRRDGTVEQLAGAPELLLGLGDDRPLREDHRTSLAPGETLVLYTDGLVERRREDVDVGIARLAERLAALGDLPVQRLADELLRAQLPQVGEDDVAIVVVRAQTARDHDEQAQG